MIQTDKQLNFYEMFCDTDGCDYTIDGNGEFLDAIARAKSLNWNIKKEGTAWVHYCPVHAPVYQPKDEGSGVPF